MVVRVDEAGRHDEAARFDYARARRDLNLVSLPYRDNRITFQDDDGIRDRVATRTVDQGRADNGCRIISGRSASSARRE